MELTDKVVDILSGTQKKVVDKAKEKAKEEVKKEVKNEITTRINNATTGANGQKLLLLACGLSLLAIGLVIFKSNSRPVVVNVYTNGKEVC